jgi:hypothetical protein
VRALAARPKRRQFWENAISNNHAEIAYEKLGLTLGEIFGTGAAKSVPAAIIPHFKAVVKHFLIKNKENCTICAVFT